MRVLITQRVDEVPGRPERRDALDQAWLETLDALLNGPIVPMPMPNRLMEPDLAVREFAPDLVVLSGGNDLAHRDGASNPAPERDETERRVLEHAMQEAVPVLAVCRGMQMLNDFLGGSMRRVVDHVGDPHDVRVCAGVDGPARLRVNSFHGWSVPEEGLADDLVACYRHEDGTIEAARHVRLPWLGVMWHPERRNPDHDDQRTWLRAALAEARCRQAP